jgi:hypothetical protein
VIALVAELKAGSFTRHTAQSIHQLLDRARQIRLVQAESVRLFIGDEEVTPPGHTRSLPVEDKTAPTIVFWGHGSTPFAELDQCAESIAILVGQPQLSAELQLAFSRLVLGADPPLEQLRGGRQPVPFVVVVDRDKGHSLAAAADPADHGAQHVGEFGADDHSLNWAAACCRMIILRV